MQICIVFFESPRAHILYRILIEVFHVKIVPQNGMVITEEMMIEALLKV